MNYIDRIKQLKSEKKITNDVLSEKTGIPLGTLSKILAGISDSPKFVNIVSICSVLGCSVDYIITGMPENHNNALLNDDEMRFLELYRGLDSYGTDLVTTVAEKEAERVASEDNRDKILDFPSSSRTASSARSSSGAARKILRGDEAASGVNVGEAYRRYSQYTGPSTIPLKRRITLYTMPVSAGRGVFLDDDSATEITIPDNEISNDATFALKISGNSMEPKYRNGDYLLVKATDTVEVGEVGVFVLDGEGYVKVYGGDTLISLNSTYKPIPLKDFENVRCVGVVTGKLKKK